MEPNRLTSHIITLMENKFKREDLPENEQERLKKLYGYNAIDSYELSGTFQHVASTAARIFNVPIAFVNFVDKDSILIKASVGVDGHSSIAREIGLCSLAVLRDEVTFFKDARTEQCLAANPLVHGDFGLQFYAGAPVKTQDGFNIGVVAIADKQPREFSKEDEQMLESLAALVMDELEERSSL